MTELLANSWVVRRHVSRKTGVKAVARARCAWFVTNIPTSACNMPTGRIERIIVTLIWLCATNGLSLAAFFGAAAKASVLNIGTNTAKENTFTATCLADLRLSILVLLRFISAIKPSVSYIG
jgi:hypothetical protein